MTAGAFVFEVRSHINDLLLVRRQRGLRKESPEGRVTCKQFGGFGHCALEVRDKSERGLRRFKARFRGFRYCVGGIHGELCHVRSNRGWLLPRSYECDPQRSSSCVGLTIIPARNEGGGADPDRGL